MPKYHPWTPVIDALKKVFHLSPEEEEGEEPEEEEPIQAHLKVSLPTITVEMAVEGKKPTEELLESLEKTFKDILRDSRREGIL